MLDGKKVAFLVANEGVEQIELTEPWQAVEEAGGQPVLIAPEAGKVQAFNHLDKADTFEVDVTASDADATAYAGLVLPGGVANPDQLRTDEDAMELVRAFFLDDKPVAAICHGPWLLVEADLLRGKKATSWPSIRTDLRNAGANVVDEPAVTDGNIVTSRNPDDVPAFTEALIRLVEQAPTRARQPSEATA